MSINLRTLSNSRIAAFAIVWCILADTALAVWFHVSTQAEVRVDGRASR